MPVFPLVAESTAIALLGATHVIGTRLDTVRSHSIRCTTPTGSWFPMVREHEAVQHLPIGLCLECEGSNGGNLLATPEVGWSRTLHCNDGLDRRSHRSGEPRSEFVALDTKIHLLIVARKVARIPVQNLREQPRGVRQDGLELPRDFFPRGDDGVRNRLKGPVLNLPGPLESELYRLDDLLSCLSAPWQINRAVRWAPRRIILVVIEGRLNICFTIKAVDPTHNASTVPPCARFAMNLTEDHSWAFHSRSPGAMRRWASRARSSATERP